jgi:hypothetical protein
MREAWDVQGFHSADACCHEAQQPDFREKSPKMIGMAA